MSLVQITFFMYWLCWKWDSLAFIKKPTYTYLALLTEIERASGFIRPGPSPARREQLKDVREQTEPRSGRPPALLSLCTCELWWRPAEGGKEEGHSVLDLCMLF